MTFPAVAASNTGTDSGALVSSSTVNLPAGIASGQRLLAFAVFDGDPGAITWPAGWVEVYRFGNAAGQAWLALAYRDTDGTEGATISVSWAAARRTGWRTLRITGALASAPPQAALTSGSNSTTADPPSLTPSWGADDTLWIATYARDSANTVTAYPASYTGAQYNKTSAPAMGQATRQLNAATENPGTFATSNDDNDWAASTVAIRPSNAIAGDSATTNANDAAAASGKVSAKGTLAATNAADTMTATNVAIAGALAVANAADAMSASGKVTVRGALAAANAADAMSASGAVPFGVLYDLLSDIHAERCWLLELDAFPLAPINSLSAAYGESGYGEMAYGEDDEGAAGGLTTLYVSSHGYTSQPGDAPSSTHYDSRLVGNVHVRRDIAGRDWVGGLTECRAHCDLNNADGALDRLPEIYAFDGRSAKLLIGRMQASRADFGLVFSGVTAKLEIGAQLVRLHFSDALARLQVPLSVIAYAGTGGNEGGADLKGKPKPKAYGNALNVPAPLVDSTNLVYQVHGGAISDVPAAYDRGIALAKVGGAPAAGQYQVTAASGTFKLGATPAGTVTADVLGDASGAGYINKTGDIVNRILLNEASLQAAEIDATAIAQLNADAPAEVGDWTGPAPRTVAEAIEQLLAGVGAFGGFSRLGKFSVGVIAAPAGAPVASYSQAEILDLERIPLPQGIDPIVWRARVAWQRNYTLQTDLAAAVTAARRTFAAQAERLSVNEDAALRSRRTLAREYGPTGNRYAQQADADAEAARLRALWGAERGLYKVTLPAIALVRDLGEVVEITHPRYGFASGKQARILGHEIDGPYVTLTVLS